MYDNLDRQILQCLIRSGRAPFRRIAAVVGASEQTVARRYRGMRDAGAVRVVAGRSGFTDDRSTWAVRIRCRPGTAVPLADALAERPDVRWVALASGGAEITCTISGPIASSSDGLLGRLPHTSTVLAFTAQALLAAFAGAVDEWTVFDPPLSDSQLAELDAEVPTATRAAAPREIDPDAPLDDVDEALLAELARDGRASVAALARDLDLPGSRVATRLAALTQRGQLVVVTDFVPAAFGFHANAILQLSVAPDRIVEIGRALASHRETGFVAATTGTANLMVLVICRSSDELFRYVTERIGSLRGVTALDVVPYLRQIKQTGCRIVDGRLVPPR